jgi:hypothetical protein
MINKDIDFIAGGLHSDVRGTLTFFNVIQMKVLSELGRGIRLKISGFIVLQVISSLMLLMSTIGKTLLLI